MAKSLLHIAAEQPVTSAYEVLSPLNHDQVDYGVGAVVQLTEAQAAPLLGHTVRVRPDPELAPA